MLLRLVHTRITWAACYNSGRFSLDSAGLGEAQDSAFLTGSWAGQCCWPRALFHVVRFTTGVQRGRCTSSGTWNSGGEPSQPLWTVSGACGGGAQPGLGPWVQVKLEQGREQGRGYRLQGHPAGRQGWLQGPLGGEVGSLVEMDLISRPLTVRSSQDHDGVSGVTVPGKGDMQIPRRAPYLCLQQSPVL